MPADIKQKTAVVFSLAVLCSLLALSEMVVPFRVSNFRVLTLRDRFGRSFVINICLFRLFFITICALYVQADSVIFRNRMNKVFCILLVS